MESAETPTVAIPYVPDEIDRKYDEMLRVAPHDWYVILDDEDDLIHAATRSDVASMLRARGVSADRMLIMKSPGPPPYLIL